MKGERFQSFRVSMLKQAAEPHEIATKSRFKVERF